MFCFPIPCVCSNSTPIRQSAELQFWLVARPLTQQLESGSAQQQPKSTRKSQELQLHIPRLIRALPIGAQFHTTRSPKHSNNIKTINQSLQQQHHHSLYTTNTTATTTTTRWRPHRRWSVFVLPTPRIHHTSPELDVARRQPPIAPNPVGHPVRFPVVCRIVGRHPAQSGRSGSER